MHTNKLATESSPYLLQHAHNPVDWYPWGPEALQRAVAEDKPILVSIGYAACHWCHVMERESFEDPGTARIMNEHFINIKIDREERPDLDHIYMDALQTMTGAGGWPLNVFLTPDKKPFYGGTYFPPKKVYNRPAWKEVLLAISNAFKEKREEIESQADNLTEHLHQSGQFGMQTESILHLPVEELFTRHQCDTVLENIINQADKTWGGFGKAPKFPGTFNIQYLLRYHHSYKAPQALEQALLSLDKMVQGGIYDQLGGGFARYSTDEKWLAPHFEKMLYDNALLVDTLCEGYLVSKKETYATAIRETLAFVDREMTDPSGAFYAALDADSEGVEGKFYVWSKTEIDQILGENASLFCEYYDVSDEGNWEEQNILWIQQPLSDFAARTGQDEQSLYALLLQCRQQLLEVRNKRIRPALDDKILLGWNALMIHAYCKASATLEDDTYLHTALKAAGTCWEKLRQDNGPAFFHTWKAGIAKYPAFLDDYACLIRACISLQEVSGDLQWLEKAKELTHFVLEHFSDEANTFFYYTIQGQEDVIIRKKEIYDGAVPSGNAIMANNLWHLSVVLDNKMWQRRAIEMVGRLSQTVTRYPTSFGVWASLILQLVQGTKELAIVGPDFIERLKSVNKHYIPFKVLLGAAADQPGIPLLENRAQPTGTWLYWCENYHCMKPVQYIEEIDNLI